ncbi:MAG: hypothetical protein NT007_10285 [Candidatus Kapabacteria bacterium]|nr:hypothetical protein [Candidatus Kapabacteria bacterium]
MKRNLYCLLIISSIIITACSNKNDYKIAITSSKKAPEFTKLDKINKKFVEKYGKKFKVELNSEKIYQLSTNIKYLTEKGKKSFDMVVMNNTGYATRDSVNNIYSDVKIVLPINSRIFYVAYNKEKCSANSIEELLKGKNVAVLSNETELIKKILTDFGVDLKEVNFLKSKFNSEDEDVKILDSLKRDSISKVDYNASYKQKTPIPYDVEIGFISQNYSVSSRLSKLLNQRQEFCLFSFDDYRMFRSGSIVEGFCMRNKYFTPFLLPKGTYGEFPETPILSIREDFVLACRDEVDDEFVYDFVKTAIDETDLIDMDLYGKNLENINFAFPLHEGTKRFLDKKAPTFYEKYAELMAKIGTGVGGFYTALMGFFLWRKKRKRKSIHDDFQRVLDIQDKLTKPHKLEILLKMYSDLQLIQQEYQKKTLEHKILVDESLRIFFDVINKNERYIIEEIKNMRVNG